MSKNYYSVSNTAPTAHVTKNRKRVKQFNDTVYLQNGDEFEIELFNPTQTKIVAKISIDGKSIGNGIIVKPGQRVFLERYVSDAKKFKFETYEVSGTNSEVRQAIDLNGNLKVEFFKEQIYTPTPTWYNYPSNIHYYGSVTDFNTPFTYTTSTSGLNYVGDTNLNYIHTTGTGTFDGSITTSNTYLSNDYKKSFVAQNSNLKTPWDMSAPKRELKLKKKETVETGRVEKGSNSNQTFTTDYTVFEAWSSWVTNWKILPVSQKLVTSEEISVVYCTECGGKRKKDTHKFCPSCGTKY